MLGTWRLFLALLVVNGHFWTPWWPGAYAVFSFYVISGYLMALVMNETYGYDVKGFARFWLNRALRLLPSYWVACICMLLLVILLPAAFVQGWNGRLRMPESIHEIVGNLTMVGILMPTESGRLAELLVLDGFKSFATLVPPAWALSIEIFYYLLISLWFGKTLPRSLLLLAGGAAYVGAVHLLADGDFWLRYFFVPGACVPFAAGCVVFHVMRRVDTVPAAGRRLVVAAYVGFFALCPWTTDPLGWALYVNVLLTAGALACLRHADMSSRWRAVDKYLGDLSYPVYLFHWGVGLLLAWILDLRETSAPFYLAVMAGVLAVSVADRHLISVPVERMRRYVRG